MGRYFTVFVICACALEIHLIPAVKIVHVRSKNVNMLLKSCNRYLYIVFVSPDGNAYGQYLATKILVGEAWLSCGWHFNQPAVILCLQLTAKCKTKIPVIMLSKCKQTNITCHTVSDEVITDNMYTCTCTHRLQTTLTGIDMVPDQTEYLTVNSLIEI